MRQQHPPAGTIFLLCTKCDRGEWRSVGSTATEPTLPECRHCGGRTVQRFPFTLALTKAERGLLNTVAAWGKLKTHDAVMAAVRKDFRKLATERAGNGKPIPQWAADWLQNNPEK